MIESLAVAIVFGIMTVEFQVDQLNNIFPIFYRNDRGFAMVVEASSNKGNKIVKVQVSDKLTPSV